MGITSCSTSLCSGGNNGNIGGNYVEMGSEMAGELQRKNMGSKSNDNIFYITVGNSCNCDPVF